MNPARTLSDQRGAVLISGLMLLLVLTLLGAAALQGTTNQYRMTGDFVRQELAFQAAEAGLRDAEAWLENTVVLPEFNNSNGLYQPDPQLASQAGTWADAAPGNYITYQGDDLGDPLPFPLPRYIIEFMAEVDVSGNDSIKFAPASGDAPRIFRITSRGVGPSGRSTVILQTTFIR
jgi:type IV pilus assembly protein PilX